MSDDALIVHPTEGMEKTKSGLSVPKGMGKQRRSIINDDWKKIRRSFTQLHEMGITLRFQCQECDELMMPMEEEKALTCTCTKWTLPGWTSLRVKE